MTTLRTVAALTILFALTGAMRAAHAFAGAVEADQAVTQAREAAASHRNAESMALFEQAIAEDPSRR
ncbi:MAG: hypothetical protein Q8R92_06085, partial [Deltaproteobacteria bacterium]|nr:hypothetical protein [Deltaproteobacteria bacterium]